MKIGNREFDVKNRTYVMGILNVTPDSFSDGGKWNTCDAALAHAEQMLADGADLIDIGGESTRPGYTAVSDEEEIDRVAPVIRAVKERLGAVVSADTYKAKVAQAALQAGADLINDIWGLKKDPDLAAAVGRSGAAYCLMHNRDEAVYQDLIADIKQDFQDSLELARKGGIAADRIILDPGVGFGKTYEQNLEVLRRLDEFCRMDYPVLLGTSRKSVIGLTLDLPVSERLEGTLATTVMAVIAGCAFVRVHDVKENKRVITMTEAVFQHAGTVLLR